MVIAWVFCLFALTAIGIAPLYVFGLNIHRLSAQNISPVVGVGIELTAYAPSLAAILVAAFIPGSGGTRRLLGQLGRWRVHPGWYVLAVLGPLAFFLLAEVIHVASGGSAPSSWLAFPAGFALAFAVGSVIAGALGEEIGWRGLGQPRLQVRHGALVASVVIGLIWSVWHYWGLAAPGGLTGFSLPDFGLNLLRLVALSILYAWMYNSTRGSLPLAMAAHAGHNIANNLVPSPAGGLQIGDIVILLYAAAAAIIVVLTGPRRWIAVPDVSNGPGEPPSP